MGLLRQLFGPSREGADELYFSVVGVIKDVDRLKSLFQIFALTPHLLRHLDSACEDAPGIQLK